MMGQASHTDVAVIGAGPYGLSLAAHLSARGVPFRIFGRTMETWRANMPDGMRLKSPGCGSSLADPAGQHRLKDFCALSGWEYRDWDLPVPLDVFVRYGEWFQASLVPTLERQEVVTCSREGPGDGDGFRLVLQGGDQVVARSVVVATGTHHSARVPEELGNLPPSLMTHSSAHASFEQLSGRRVAVIGAGQSALESAVLLQEVGASPLVVARREVVEWNPRPAPRRSAYQKVRYPRTAIGTGFRYVFFEHPFLPFYYLPRDTRRRLMATVLGPAGGWWLRKRFEGQVPIRLGWSVRAARPAAGEVVLELQRGAETAELHADHVIAATGYCVTPASFPFLSRNIHEAMSWEDGWPTLSRGFEATPPGLHFIGLASARFFGPVMRFVAGVHAAAPRLADHLAHRHAA